MYQKYDTVHFMDDKSCVIYSGDKFTLEWYYDKNWRHHIIIEGKVYFSGIDRYHTTVIILVDRINTNG